MRSFILLLAILWFGASAPDAFALAQMEISNVSDLVLGTWSIGEPGVSSSMDLCIYSLLNSPTGGYAITATGGNGGYVLTNGTNQLPYTLFWDDSGAGNLGSSSTQLINGIKLTGQINANTVSPLCVSGVIGNNARLTLKIAQSDLISAMSGSYSGTITLLLSPN